jgi:2-polyprenyl-6-hydroxyphenyl methylase/3-demethylubiquinone-9 3-methyltransferase
MNNQTSTKPTEAQISRQHSSSTIDPDDVARFSAIAAEWWDENGKFKPLHRINPLRIGYIRDAATEHFALDAASVAPLEGLSLLDVGCGGGLISEPMARLGAAVTGIDASENNIKTATIHAQETGTKVTYRATTAEDLAATGAQYDMVLALEIIEHVADLTLFYDAITTLVKPGGLLVLSTINRNPKSYVMAIVGAEYIMRWLPVGTHNWSQFVRPSEMTHALTSRGCMVKDMQGMIFNPLRNSFSLSKTDLDVNYLMVAKKD